MPDSDPPGDVPAPPKHLSAEAKRIWRDVLDRYDLDRETVATLAMALDARDLANRARNRIERDGHVVDGRYGLRVHPSFEVLKSSWSAWVTFVRALDLPELEGEDEPQPRDLRGKWGRVARTGGLHGR